jgi:hypothetical protein
MNSKTQHPDIQFFTNLVDSELNNITQKPPLASAIQSLETCLLLISLDRFPSALASCAMAIESAWKAATNTGQDFKGDFANILGEVNLALPKSAPSFNLKEFRRLRNDVVHFGYSPKDDEASARMLFSTGIPVFFMFLANHKDLNLDLESCLQSGLHDQLQLTLNLNQAHLKKNISAIESSQILRHHIKRMILNLTIWQELALEEENLSQQIEFESKSKFKEMIKKRWHCNEELRCPVCDFTELIVRLDETSIAKGKLKGTASHCVNCDLNLQPTILNHFIDISLTSDEKAVILRGYGY